MLKLIVKSILPRDEALLKRSLRTGSGLPRTACRTSVSDGSAGFLGGHLQNGRAQGSPGADHRPSIAKEAVQRLTAEKPFG
jgi:hypothetical protein